MFFIKDFAYIFNYMQPSQGSIKVNKSFTLLIWDCFVPRNDGFSMLLNMNTIQFLHCDHYDERAATQGRPYKICHSSIVAIKNSFPLAMTP